jgi:GNAT superfamily N-acetyltransferase
MELGVDAAVRAWARLIGIERLERGPHVLVDATSPLAPAGWIGVLVLGDTITASVPSDDLVDAVTAALEGLTPEQATAPDVLVPRLPEADVVLSGAGLFYPPSGYAVDAPADVDELPIVEVRALLDAASADERDESGIDHVATVYVARAASGELAAACGHRRWPNDVAHLSVLTHPAHRRAGHGRRAGAAAIGRALEDGLLPQWRARPLASKALAARLGLVQMGVQLAVRPLG